jgi:hypothetical protein
VRRSTVLAIESPLNAMARDAPSAEKMEMADVEACRDALIHELRLWFSLK